MYIAYAHPHNAWLKFTLAKLNHSDREQIFSEEFFPSLSWTVFADRENLSNVAANDWSNAESLFPYPSAVLCLPEQILNRTWLNFITTVAVSSKINVNSAEGFGKFPPFPRFFSHSATKSPFAKITFMLSLTQIFIFDLFTYSLNRIDFRAEEFFSRGVN